MVTPPAAHLTSVYPATLYNSYIYIDVCSWPGVVAAATGNDASRSLHTSRSQLVVMPSDDEPV